MYLNEYTGNRKEPIDMKIAIAESLIKRKIGNSYQQLVSAFFNGLITQAELVMITNTVGTFSKWGVVETYLKELLVTHIGTSVKVSCN